MTMEIFTRENTEFIFFTLEQTRGVQQGDEFHPEKDVFEHSLQVFKWAVRESNDVDLILAGLLHDVGKAVEKLGHPEIGVDLLREHVSEKTLWLVKNHLRIWTFLSGEMQGLKKVQELAFHPWLPELVQLARWDKKGRKAGVETTFDKDKVIQILNEKSALHFRKDFFKVE